MRLIDADKLKISYDGHFVGVAKNDLDNAPTVEAEPITYGHWRKVNPMVDTVECSECGYQLLSEELETPHCAWCGAKMKNVEDTIKVEIKNSMTTGTSLYETEIIGYNDEKY